MFRMNFIFTISSLFIRCYFGIKGSEKMGAKYLQELEMQFNGKFDLLIANKVIKWNSIQQQFVCNSFSALFGRDNTPIEEERNLLYFLTTALYDEIIDTQSLSTEALDELFYHPQKAIPGNFEQAVLLHLHLQLLNQVPDQEAYWSVIHQIHIAQKESIQQFDPNTSDERLLSITERKGGYSLLMCRHYLDIPSSKELDACWYALGSVIQMTNDLYDIHKDLQSGIETFATRAKHSSAIAALYNLQVGKLNESIRKLPVAQQKKNKLGITLSIIPGFGYIALENLQTIQGQAPCLPPLNALPRKALVIDMENNANRAKLVRFAYQNAKNIVQGE